MDDDISVKQQTSKLGRRVVYFIVLTPILMILSAFIGTVGLYAVGAIDASFNIAGELAIETVWRTFVAPLGIFVIASFAFVWILAIMSVFGASSVIKVGKALHKMVIDYQG